MNKRRKRMPLVEDFDLDELLTPDQKDQMFGSSKRQKVGPLNELTKASESTEDDHGSTTPSNLAGSSLRLS